MKVFGLSYALSLLVSYILLSHFNLHQYDLSFFAGSGLALINVAALYFSWNQILAKKNLVLSGGVIVIKYPLLGFILYEVVHLKQISLMWFLIGMGTFIPAAVVTGIWLSITAPKISEAEVSLEIPSERLKPGQMNKPETKES